MFHDLICAVICKYDPGLSAFDTWSRKERDKICFFTNWLSSYTHWICGCFSPVGLWRESEFLLILTKPHKVGWKEMQHCFGDLLITTQHSLQIQLIYLQSHWRCSERQHVGRGGKQNWQLIFMLPGIQEYPTANVYLCLLSSATGAVLDIEERKLKPFS